MKSLNELATELVENFDRAPEGVSVSISKLDPKAPVINEDIENARKIWASIKA